MFRKMLLLAGVAGAALSVAACATNPVTGQPTVAPVISTSTDTSVTAKIQSAVHGACSYLPSATTVGAIVASFTGGEAIEQIIAAAVTGICNAVTVKGFKRGRHGTALPVYRGVVIRGRYL